LEPANSLIHETSTAKKVMTCVFQEWEKKYVMHKLLERIHVKHGNNIKAKRGVKFDSKRRSHNFLM